MSVPPEVQLEADDSKEFQEHLRPLSQMKRLLSLKIGRPTANLDDMQVVRSLMNMLGEAPTDARKRLVEAQGQLNIEELLRTSNEMEAQSFMAISVLETLAGKVEAIQKLPLIIKGRRSLGVSRSTGSGSCKQLRG